MTMFHPDAFVNVKLPAVTRIDGRSPAAVAKLAAWARLGAPQPTSVTVPPTMHGTAPPPQAKSPWFNATNVYVTDANTPRKRVTLKVTWWLQADQQALCDSIPIPDYAVGDASSDKSLVIVDPPNRRMYDFWRFNRGTDGVITAEAMGVIRDYPNSPGAYNEMSRAPESAVSMGTHWGTQASGFPHHAGLVMVDEFRAGVIGHAVAVAPPWAMKDWFSHPAQRTDGTDTGPGAIPYGARFRLPATFSLAAYTLERRKTTPTYTPTPVTQALCDAWRDYGMIPMDQTGWGVGIQVEAAKSWMAQHPGEPDPYGPPYAAPSILRSPPNYEMALLPWEKLQLLSLDLRRR